MAQEERPRNEYGVKSKGEKEYDTYTSDRFGRVLAYVIVEDKNVVVELARRGMVKVTIYEDRRKLKYQDELLKAQNEARKMKRGIWR